MGCDFVFQTDSDGQFVVEDFWKLWEKRQEAGFICGIRTIRKDPLHRLVINKLLKIFLWGMFQTYLHDPNIPFRLMKSSTLKSLLELIPPTPFAPNIFLSLAAKRTLPNIIEIPVTHQERKTGTVSIVRWKLIRVCLRSAKELFLFRRRFSALPS